MGKRKTHEEFIKQVYRLVGSEYTVLGHYKGHKTKILMRHNKCGNEYYVRPCKFVQGKRCPKCMQGQITHSEFVKKMYDLVGDEYTVLNQYKDSKTKVLIKHNKCGHEYEVRPDSFISGNRCPKCRIKNITKTHEQFVKEIKNLAGEEYIVLGKYKNSGIKILMKHNKCGHEWKVTPSSFLNNGRRCPKCSGLMRKTTEQFKKKVYEAVGNKYTILGEYVNNNTKILVRHNECGHEWKAVPHNLFSILACPKCSKCERKNTEIFKKEVYDLVQDEYKVLGEYINSHTKILIRHNDCEMEYEVSPANFLRGTRCPKCIFSRGEKAINDYLTENNIRFETEKTFDDLIFKRNLRFDFYLPDYNLIIEYDGRQHYKPSSFGSKNKLKIAGNFKSCKKRDRMKDRYCKENGIELLRIPYHQYNEIGSILDNLFLSFQADPNVNVSGTWK